MTSHMESHNPFHGSSHHQPAVVAPAIACHPAATRCTATGWLQMPAGPAPSAEVGRRTWGAMEKRTLNTVI